MTEHPVEPAPPRQVELARITTLHPRTYNEARTIGEHFREGTPVIMNLTEMVDSDARRLVDFAAGLIFGLRGSIDKVTNKVFLLSPANVEVTAEDKARIAERGFFNQASAGSRARRGAERRARAGQGDVMDILKVVLTYVFRCIWWC